MIDLRPCTVKAARRFVAAHHRHNQPPAGGLFAIAAYVDGELAGVGIAGRPVAMPLNDGVTVEVSRCCTTGARNAPSSIYGALCRAAKALGYHRVVTYTLASEPGTSLRSAGFVVDAELPARAGWASPARPRYDVNLFGDDLTPAYEAKLRWVRWLVADIVRLPLLTAASSERDPA